jgi:hypothetical protein
VAAVAGDQSAVRGQCELFWPWKAHIARIPADNQSAGKGQAARGAPGHYLDPASHSLKMFCDNRIL